MASRIDSFTGSSAEYVEYLELTIRHLRVHHQTCTIQAHDLGRPPSGTDIRADAACTPQAAPSAAPAYSSHALEPRHSFQFISYQPCGEQPKRRKPNGPWQKFATHLVEKTPKAQNWWFAVKESGIDEAMSTGKIAAFLLDRDCPTPSSSSRAIEVSVSQDGGNDALLTRLTSYARVAMLRETNATMMMVLANFQKFLVLSSCAVLRASGVSIESVHDIVKVCIGDIGEVYCRRTLRVAIFLNELIDKLDARGWGSRASELFLLCKVVQSPETVHANLHREPTAKLIPLPCQQTVR